MLIFCSRIKEKKKHRRGITWLTWSIYVSYYPTLGELALQSSSWAGSAQCRAGGSGSRGPARALPYTPDRRKQCFIL